ncbi:hypothetical protein NQ036_03650 [Brevibacterium sp. 91QC2O2]|uniref:hypothetical protein n=1 Tax=Brevibacterium TaxID=1696 RepID=UPI00211BBED5|nr:MULTISPECIES: hypothetical protein [unclassified Brevibacterium]MCQ9367341.1 hypothetical protein [Brevibacterium sp. 91QC2O2]MCQ9384646.1 hypothetical protein [Brevibacterium sp. 68QC2CO]
MRHPHGETITVHPYIDGALDANGNPVPAFGDDYTRTGIAVAPHVEPAEIDPNRRMVVDGFDLYDTVDTPVTDRDHITVRGHRYRVVGEIARWSDPFKAAQSGAVITITRAKG